MGISNDRDVSLSRIVAAFVQLWPSHLIQLLLSHACRPCFVDFLHATWPSEDVLFRLFVAAVDSGDTRSYTVSPFPGFQRRPHSPGGSLQDSGVGGLMLRHASCNSSPLLESFQAKGCKPLRVVISAEQPWKSQLFHLAAHPLRTQAFCLDSALIHCNAVAVERIVCAPACMPAEYYLPKPSPTI